MNGGQNQAAWGAALVDGLQRRSGRWPTLLCHSYARRFSSPHEAIFTAPNQLRRDYY
jgi:hypothetical protein